MPNAPFQAEGWVHFAPISTKVPPAVKVSLSKILSIAIVSPTGKNKLFSE
jgi:hypothetical protein